MNTIAVIDFETTGLSPVMGDRATEIAVVLMEGDQVVDRFHSLMNAGVRIPPFIEAYTGISNAMIAIAPRAESVMADASRFVGQRPMAAHNAAFDRRFWTAELQHVDHPAAQPFACTLLLSRRLYPQAINYKLGSLAALHALACTGRAHRALADAEVAAALLGRIRSDLRIRYRVAEPHHALLMKLQACARKALDKAIDKHLSTQQSGASGGPGVQEGVSAPLPVAAATLSDKTRLMALPE